MYHVIAVRLQLVEKHGQRHCRGPMDIVHQNDAAAFRVQPPHGAFYDRFRTAAAPPIVRVDVRAPGDQLFALQEPFNRIGAAEVRNAEEERERFGVAKCGGGVEPNKQIQS
jgi:hypothetical protein